MSAPCHPDGGRRMRDGGWHAGYLSRPSPAGTLIAQGGALRDRDRDGGDIRGQGYHGPCPPRGESWDLIPYRSPVSPVTTGVPAECRAPITTTASPREGGGKKLCTSPLLFVVLLISGVCVQSKEEEKSKWAAKKKKPFPPPRTSKRARAAGARRGRGM